MEEPLQKSLERYDVLDRIAGWRHAEVFLAKAYGAHGFEKTLAIKRILPELASDPEFAARFIAEAKVAVRLSHAKRRPGVSTSGASASRCSLRWSSSTGLDHRGDAAQVQGRAAPGAAPRGVPHRDRDRPRARFRATATTSSPRRVAVEHPDLAGRRGELADFGIAIAASPHRGGGPGPRKVMGKWRYMSPEQARGDTLDNPQRPFLSPPALGDVRAVHRREAVPRRGVRGHHQEHRVDGDSADVRGSGTACPSRLERTVLALAPRPQADQIARPAPASILRSLIECRTSRRS